MSTPRRRATDQHVTQRARDTVVTAASWLHTHRDRLIGGTLVVLSIACVIIAVGLSLNSAADHKERRSNRVEAQRTCMRSYKIGPQILDALERAGLDPVSAAVYRASLPTGRTVQAACP